MALRLAICLLALTELNHASPQIPLEPRLPAYPPHQTPIVATKSRKLTGKFLHITDIHPDPFYKVHSSTDDGVACHRHNGPAGVYGAETTDCDSPLSLVNATFRWMAENIKGEIDFVIWTGDSARHDNDENIPRDKNMVLEQNQMLLDKFQEVWGQDNGRLEIPLIPNIGNNDILPHNIMRIGPNQWTKEYLRMWKHYIPEEQRHQFDRGAWFYVEVIPNKLAVFSINTMYFFDKNAAVDGCIPGEPGFEQMEWFQIQLQLLRSRGMKAILTGHVPPARNKEKQLWDETCYQKYALFLQQYRDVIITGIYGHMNVEHFILHDFDDIDMAVAEGTNLPSDVRGSNSMDDDDDDDMVSVKSHSEYLVELRGQWRSLPEPPTSALDTESDKYLGPSKSKKKKKKDKKKLGKFFKAIGGEYGERFAVSQVTASVVPNYFPVLRVYSYNITGLESLSVRRADDAPTSLSEQMGSYSRLLDDELHVDLKRRQDEVEVDKKKKKKKPKFPIPDSPSDDAPPGPAYSPQALSLTGYTQYYANITYMNNDFESSSAPSGSDYERDPLQQDQTHDPSKINYRQLWQEGKWGDRDPDHPEAKPRNFSYNVAYDTYNKSDVYGLQSGLHVRNYIDLATRVGEYEPDKKSHDSHEPLEADADDIGSNKSKKKKKKKKEKKKRRKFIDATWHGFVQRAFIGSLSEHELKEKFGEDF